MARRTSSSAVNLVRSKVLRKDCPRSSSSSSTTPEREPATKAVE